ncbi:hypothetical protein C5676_019555 [Bacillus thuringiensis]|nr:hypothetical protein [Bacillus thuringiensis]
MAEDVCEELEINQLSVALEKLDEDEKVVINIHNLGGNQDKWGISEIGLYSLIMTSLDFLIQLATNLKHEQETRKLAESKVAEQQEVIEVLELKAEYHDNVLESTNSFTITEIAHDLISISRSGLVKEREGSTLTHTI